MKVFYPRTVTTGLYKFGLNKISIKSFSSFPVILINDSHLTLSGFQNARIASPLPFLLVKEAKCLVSPPYENATETQLWKGKF